MFTTQWSTSARKFDVLVERGDRFGGNDRVLSVPAVKVDSGNLTVFAEDKVSAPAPLADKAMPAVPAHAHALAGRPTHDAGAHRIDHARHLVRRAPRSVAVGVG